MRVLVTLTLVTFGSLWFSSLPATAGLEGYYRQPALAADNIIFVSEGDLWKVPVKGGTATRLTTHPGDEGLPAVSPDGRTLAFTGQYEGPTEVYTMPLAGGTPERRTYGASRITFVGWTPDGDLLYAGNNYAALPDPQLVRLRLGKENMTSRLVPLAQAADGSYDDAGKVLYFTRLPFQGSHTKRYGGGTAQNVWKFAVGDAEARPLTVDFKGTSKAPLWWQGRVYFVSDRDGTMNLWSMAPDGADLRQHTRHKDWDVASPSLGSGRIVYQLGADLHLYDIGADRDYLVPIKLSSDFDQTRDHWVKKPMDYLTSVHLAPDGSRIALTSRGRVFVAPHHQGRLVEATRREGVRYRNTRFTPDGQSLLALSDESGEVELWKLPANGVGPAEQLTHGADVLRWEALPSPDGKFIAHTDKNQRLFILNVKTKADRLVEESAVDFDDGGQPRELKDLHWSGDGEWLAYVAAAENQFRQIKLHSITAGTTTAITSDRFDSYSPAWSPDGEFLYLLSDRNLQSVVKSPWGNYQPEPFLDKKTKIYQIALRETVRSPFDPADELHPEEVKEEQKKEKEKEQEGTADKKKRKPSAVTIDLSGIQARLQALPLPPGNYSKLAVTDKALFWLSRAVGEDNASLQAAAIARDHIAAKTVVADVRDYELSADGKKLLVRKGDQLYLIDAVPAAADLDKKEVNLSGWALSVQPREEWRQMFVEAWRLERDYFYDRGLHGADWKGVLERYRPLVDRVNSRAELSDLMAQMVSELSALHIFVLGGDLRKGEDKIDPATLGAKLTRADDEGGYRVEHVYKSDPDEPERASPLVRPGVGVKEGDVIESVNGTPTLTVADIGQLLRRQAGRQVLLRVKSAGKSWDVIVTPLSQQADSDLRYHEWEYTRRLEVVKLGKGEVGYVHLRAMRGDNFTEWAKGFYPVFTRKGLIIDVRHNAGGNIDSWILNRLLRKAWFHWNQRVGKSPRWNMQYAFRGHIVVLCDEFTASDGEAFAEGIKRLKLGKVIGTRTWGGEIWLTFSNFLADKGIASSAEFGVYGPEGTWLIEGHGVDPDIVVDNLPHATFKGEDAQLRAAVAQLQRMIEEHPITVPPAPPFPHPAATLGGGSDGKR
jgi:tricorn protease